MRPGAGLSGAGPGPSCSGRGGRAGAGGDLLPPNRVLAAASQRLSSVL